MEEALSLDLLRGALNDTVNLPTPEQLQQQLAAAEVATFFARTDALTPVLLETAWNLHHVGTVRPALQLYGAARQVQANAVAAHIFDLALQSTPPSAGDRLVLTFAAQVSSIRGDRLPNASALARRLPPPEALLGREPGRVSLELGCTLLSLNRAATMALLRDLTAQIRELEASELELEGSELGGLRQGSIFSAAVGVVDGCQLLQRYLTSGDPVNLEGARTQFAGAANSPTALRDLDSRWVAAHLLDLCDDLGDNSVWAILPPGTPPAAAQAMTLGEPPVMALWPPQVSLLTDSVHSPLRADVKRAVLTFPTSAGKTLLTQLVIAHHLATQDTGVCVVAPSHSLCREIREGLDRRLWVLRSTVAEDGALGDPGRSQASVVVMTPERLASRLRGGEEELLAEFGLFVLDEAHLVRDSTRGWTFETTIARLHELTEGHHQRMILVSAAMGGTASVQTWLDVTAPPASAVARWRAPRRLHVTYTTNLDPATTRTVPATGRQKLPRVLTDMTGVVELFIGSGEAIARRSTPLGVQERSGTQTRSPSVPDRLKPIVTLAARSGPVLTVHATKRNAEAMALALAQDRPERDELVALVRLAALRMGPTHPLVDVLSRGVAYHHAALPVDVQVEIENGVRAGIIDIVCATTTLTEGVNLPVRTVVICERGYWDGTAFQELIGSADLMNAAGRAGRAGRETEGWIIVAQQSQGPSARDALRNLDQDQDIRSTLSTAAALADLTEYELLVADATGVVLAEVPTVVDGFLAYAWYLADAADLLDPTSKAIAVIEGIRKTLAWHQLSATDRDRWEVLALRLLTTYDATDEATRRRWARSGARLSANVLLERTARSFGEAALALSPAERAAPFPVLDLLLSDGRLADLLTLVDEREYRFKRKRFGPTQLVIVDLKALVLDWLTGMDLIDLAKTHLAEVEEGDDGAYRYEQLSTFLARVCEHHLPWVVGTILEWVKSDPGVELCPNLGAYIHFGVADPIALQMMTASVRSRRIAVIVGIHASAHGVVSDGIRSWLAQLGAAEWRSAFGAGAAEIGDLLQFTRDPGAATSAHLLDGQPVAVAIELQAPRPPDTEEFDVGYVVTDERPRPLGIIRHSGEVVALLQPSEYHDVAVLIDAGFRLQATLPASDPPGALLILQQD